MDTKLPLSLVCSGIFSWRTSTYTRASGTRSSSCRCGYWMSVTARKVLRVAEKASYTMDSSSWHGDTPGAGRELAVTCGSSCSVKISNLLLTFVRTHALWEGAGISFGKYLTVFLECGPYIINSYSLCSDSMCNYGSVFFGINAPK